MTNLEMDKALMSVDKKEAGRNESVYDAKRVHAMAEELFYLWMFIGYQKLIEDAREFLEEYGDYPEPLIL